MSKKQSLSKYLANSRNINNANDFNKSDTVNLVQICKMFKMPKQELWCFRCNVEILITQPIVKSYCCGRVWHEQCWKVTNLSNSSINYANVLLPSPTHKFKSDLKCHNCKFINNCQKCSLSIRGESKKYLKCTICCMSIHFSCTKIPEKIIRASQNKHFFNRTDEFNFLFHYVCESCLQLFGIDRILATQISQDQQKFLLILVNHISPIHCTWINQNQIYKLQNVTGIDNIKVIGQTPQIQLILSLHVPDQMKEADLQKCWKLTTDPRRSLQYGTQSNMRFLVKWRCNDLRYATWEDETVVRKFPKLIDNFFFQVKMGWISFTNLDDQDNLIKMHLQQLQNFNAKLKIVQKIKFIGKNQSEMFHEDSIQQNAPLPATSTKLLNKIYQEYLNSHSQTILTPRESYNIKYESIGMLINTIYFIHKKMECSIIFTFEKQIMIWKKKIGILCPYLSVLTLSGQPKLLQYIINKYLFVSANGATLMRSNILLISFEAFNYLKGNIQSILTEKKISLVVFDQYIPNQLKILYQKIKYPKILFQRKMRLKEEKESKSQNSLHETTVVSKMEEDEQFMSNSSTTVDNCKSQQVVYEIDCFEEVDTNLNREKSNTYINLSTDSRTFKNNMQFNPQKSTFSINQQYQHSKSSVQQNTFMSEKYKPPMSLKLEDEENKSVNSNEQFHKIWISHYKKFILQKQDYQSASFSELKRVAVLRCILSFGLIHQDLKKFHSVLCRFAPQIFNKDEEKEDIPKLEKHIEIVLIILSKFKSNDVVQANRSLVEFYMFGVKVTQLFRRVIMISRAHQIYVQYKDKPLEFKTQIQPTIFIGVNKVRMKNWPPQFDILICSFILEKGYGKWDDYSQIKRVWTKLKEGSQVTAPVTFKDFVCGKVNLGEVKKHEFNNFLKKRVQEFIFN